MKIVHANLNEINSMLYGDYKTIPRVRWPTVGEPLVYHLYGDIGHPSSMVLTEKDYIDFVIFLNTQALRNLPPVIRKAIAMNLLLFVGYNLKDMSLVFSFIMRSLQVKYRLGSVMNLPRFPEDIDASQMRDLEEYLRITKKVNVYWGSALSFCDELRNYLNRRKRHSTI